MYLTKNKTERCVMARIQRQGKRYQANFSLREHGDWKAALAAGQAWVDSLIKNLPPRKTGGMSSRNSSGVVGVHRHRQVLEKRVGRKNKKYVFWSWIANWPGCVHRGGVKWSMKQFGKDDAFVLAVLCRRMETVDRTAVQDKLAELRETPEYGELLNLRKSGA